VLPRYLRKVVEGRSGEEFSIKTNPWPGRPLKPRTSRLEPSIRQPVPPTGVIPWRNCLRVSQRELGTRAALSAGLGQGTVISAYRNPIDALKPFQNPKAAKLTVTTNDELPGRQGLALVAKGSHKIRQLAQPAANGLSCNRSVA
jgi:hypothetical protein